MESEPPTVRLITKVVVAYDLASLPPYVIRCCSVLRRKLERVQLQVHVLMRPLSDLPADADVIFAPAALVAAAQAAVPGAQVLPLVAEASHQPAFEALLTQLAEGRTWRAQRSAPTADLGRRIVRYRGNERLD